MCVCGKAVGKQWTTPSGITAGMYCGNVLDKQQNVRPVLKKKHMHRVLVLCMCVQEVQTIWMCRVPKFTSRVKTGRPRAVPIFK